ncbi:MAG: VTT domain-containing protein [Halolamina sp.]|uniref:TVP38/TMEM64 family protein n=1 Tax=Halolamina sp. TaxID=1940283 RepID=UPI002FC28E62
MQRRHRLGAGLALLLVVAVGALLTSPQWLLGRVTWLAADPVRFVGALVLLAAVRPFLAWPTTLLAVVVGYGWGIGGLPLALALIVLTSVPLFLLGRRSNTGGRFADAGERAVDVTGDLRSVVISRLFPAPSDVVSFAAGLAGVPLRAFALGTAIGELPWAFAGIVAGESIQTVLAEGLGAVVSPQLAVAAALVGLLLLAGPVYRHATQESAL